MVQARMNKNKKAQITIFVILGLVLLIVFVIILSIKRSAESKVVNVQRILNELETGTLKNHVTNCIIQVSMEGIEKIGANGGVIYDFEGGTIPFADKVLGADYLNYTYHDHPYFVAYALKENTLCKNISYDIPDYPYPNSSFNNFTSIYNTNCLYNSFYSFYDGFFGQNVMNKLCYIIRESGCESFAKGRILGLTIQRQLEDYVTKKLPGCVDFSAFTARLAADISVEAEPFVETNIHDSEVIFIVRYPIKISFENQEPVTRIINYQTNLNVRLGAVYNFLYNVLAMDSKKIWFNINNEFISSYYWRQGLELNKTSTPCTNCSLPYKYDDIIEVTDRASLVNGRPFLFRAAVNNRRPALDFIQDMMIDTKNTILINMPLNAYDPDDNDIKYYFLSLGYGRDDCNPSSLSSIGDTGWCENDIDLISELDQGVLWAPLNRYDSGEHRVGILALDDSGLFDYQLFLINITDTTTTNSPTSTCLTDCSFSPSPIADCDIWCTIANNQCESECLGGFDSNPASQCWLCADLIINSKNLQTHINCDGLTKQQCIDNMPDCFWVIQNTSNNFEEACYNDASLNTINSPAYIITS